MTNFPKVLHFFGDRSAVLFFHESFLYLITIGTDQSEDFCQAQNFKAHVLQDLQDKLRSRLSSSRERWANLWELCGAGFRQSAVDHNRLVFDSVSRRRSVLGVALVVPIVLRVLSCVVEGRVNEEDEVLVVKGR